MATSETFKVSKKGVEGVLCTYLAPENLEDPAWQELVSDVKEDVHNLALQALVVRMQAAGRAHIEQGPEAVQAAVDRYKFNARAGGFRIPSIEKKTAKSLKFTDEQIAALRAAGVMIEV